MNKTSLYISIVALLVSGAALFVASKKEAIQATPAEIDVAELSTVLYNNPQMVIDALQQYENIQREAQAREAARLFLENIEEINNDPNTPFVGPEDAEIVLVEFFDFSCGYCKRLAPAIEAIVKANPDVKVVFKPITFVAPISKYAAQAALAASEQGKFMEVYSQLLATNGLTEAKIDEIAQKAGLDMDKYKEDVNSQKVKDTVQAVANLGNKVQIHGVPSLLLNGQQLNTIDVDGIQAEINKLK